MKRRRFSTGSKRVIRFPVAISFAFLALSFGSIILVARRTSEVVMWGMVEEQMHIDKPTSGHPENATSRTVRLSSPVIERHDTTTTVGENQHGTPVADISIPYRRNLSLQNNTVETVPHQNYRYRLGLVRTLGNPIPPRHNENQTLTNLEFLLEHEPAFETTVDKHWILNRIANDEFLEQLKRTLRLHNQTFSVVSFDIRAYDSKPYRYEKASKKILGKDWRNRGVDLLRSRSYWEGGGDEDSKRENERKRIPYLEELYKDKTLYVLNENNARNLAMELYSGNKKKETKFLVDYILPWDGDCFLSQEAHDSLHRDLERHNDEQQERIAAARRKLRKEMRADDDDTDGFDTDDFIDNEISYLMNAISLPKFLNAPINYFYTPIERLSEGNEVVINRLENEFDTNQSKRMLTKEQPQLVLHRTAKTRFDGNGINMDYILGKLKIKGPWNEANNKTYSTPRDYNYHPYMMEDEEIVSSSGNDGSLSSFKKDDFATPAVGWATGLVSGQSDLGTRGGASQREGLALFCRSLDARAVNEFRYKPGNNNLELKKDVSSYLYYDERILKKESSVYKLYQETAKVKKSEIPPLFDHLVQRLNGLADRLIKYGTFFKLSSKYSRQSIAKFQFDCTIFGLAYEFTGEVKYAKQAAEKIRSWFLDPDARLYQMWSAGQQLDSVGEAQSLLKKSERLKLSFVDFENVTEFLQEAKTDEQSVELSDSDNKLDLALSDFNDVYFFLDAVKMVEKSGELSKSEIDGMKDWFRHYLDRLVAPGKDLGNWAYYQNDHRGLYYDIQLISVAAFTGNHSLAVQIAHESTSRLIGHARKIHQSLESGDGDCVDDLMFTLQGWMTLARILSNYLGVQLWKELPIERFLNSNDESKETMEQPFLCRAPEYAVFLSQRDRKSCTDQDEDADSRWLPIHWSAEHWDCPAPWKFSEEGLSHYTEEPTHGAASFGDYHNHGIAPFWNLGLA